MIANRKHPRPCQAKTGDIVIVRYYDTVIFKDISDSFNMKPLVRESVGWLDYQDGEYLRLVWERYAEPMLNADSKIKSTGLAIRKADVIGLKRIA
ncbi:hypothetical protein MUP77_24970 [Candidatus Bathyarchaeota archaeon]|nr:hypothetical protein [Candidatus Bathyarchaeota archaeon]